MPFDIKKFFCVYCLEGNYFEFVGDCFKFVGDCLKLVGDYFLLRFDELCYLVSGDYFLLLPRDAFLDFASLLLNEGEDGDKDLCLLNSLSRFTESLFA